MIACLVWGTNGQHYSDRDEWDVAVYYDKVAAEEHAKLANEWKSCLRDEKGEFLGEVTDLIPDPDNPGMNKWTYDERFVSPYDIAHTKGVSTYSLAEYEWNVKEVPLVRHIDEFLENQTQTK